MDRPKRWIYMGLGWLFVGLGSIGVVLPVLPTTPFMLLALWCFARSSDRFHDWLYTHKFFGPPLQDWDQHRVIPLKAKILSVTFMTGSLIYVFFFTKAPALALVVMGGVIAYGAWFILTKPSRAETKPQLEIADDKPD